MTSANSDVILFIFNCLNWKIYCNDHTSLSDDLILDYQRLKKKKQHLPKFNLKSGGFDNDKPFKTGRSLNGSN